MPTTGTPTQHYGFGQYVDTDVTDWADNNVLASKVDTSLFNVETQASAAQSSADAARGIADAANQAAVAAGNKADAVASTVSDNSIWFFGSFTNPDQNRYDVYDIRYKYNKAMSILSIYGYIDTSIGGTDGFKNNDNLFRLSEIPNLVLPISSKVIYNAGSVSGSSGNQKHSFVEIPSSGNAFLNHIQTGGTTENLNLFVITATISTYGWGTSE